MAKIKLPINTIRPAGKFFEQVTEAVMRGGKVEYKENYALVTIPDTRFFTKNDLNAVLNAEGDVFILPMFIVITINEYNNSALPEEILTDLGIENGIYYMADLFKITENDNMNLNDAGDIEQVEVEKSENIKIMLSFNNEWINASIAKKIANFFNVDIEI